MYLRKLKSIFKTKFQCGSNAKKKFKLLLEIKYANFSELLFSGSNYCKRKAVVNVILLSFKVHLSVDQKDLLKQTSLVLFTDIMKPQ